MTSQNNNLNPPKKFIEVLNWNTYQEYLEKTNTVTWRKRMLSVGNCEAYVNLDYKDQAVLEGIWDIAAKQKSNIIKAEPEYIFRHALTIKKISDIELDKLINACDDLGRPNPFIRYVDAPVLGDDSTPEPAPKHRASNSGKKRTKAQAKSAGKKAQATAAQTGTDPLYNTACKIAMYHGYISARKLQQKLRIGALRAKAIIEIMDANGLLGGYFNGKGYAYKPALEKRNVDKKREESDSYRNPEKTEAREEKINKDGSHRPARQQAKEQKNPRAEAEKQKQALLSSKSQDSSQEAANPPKSDKTDGSAVSTHILPKQPTSSFRGGHAQPIGRIIRGEFPLHWDGGECEEFGRDVMAALGIVADKNIEYSKQEWGAFANWLFKLKGVCSAGPVIEDLKEKMIAKAAVVNKRKGIRNKSAVLFHIMAGELQSRGLNLPDVLESPAIISNVKSV